MDRPRFGYGILAGRLCSRRSRGSPKIYDTGSPTSAKTFYEQREGAVMGSPVSAVVVKL